MYCMVEQWRRNPWKNLFNWPLSTQYFSSDPRPPHPPPHPPTLKLQMPPSQVPPAPNHPPRTHRHTERSLFCALKKRLHRIKRSNVFNISMTIVTISDKIVERIFESSNGVLFWNHWKNSGPLPTNGCNRIIKLMLVKTRKNVRCLTYKRGKNSSDNI